MQLYKKAGVAVSSSRLAEYRLPQLYVHKLNFENFSLDVQAGYIEGLKEIYTSYKNTAESQKQNSEKEAQEDVFDLLGRLYEKLGRTPTPDSLQHLLRGVTEFIDSTIASRDMVNLIFARAKQQRGVQQKAVSNLLLALHYGRQNNFSRDDIRNMALSAFLQDVGIYRYLGKRVSEEEIQKHPEKSAMVLERCNIQNDAIKYAVLEHHERLDGSGIPYGKRRLSSFGQLVGIISEFYGIYSENSVRDVRPIHIFQYMKQDVQDQKFNPELFKQFAYSLL
ncbi:HD-GYP domain-containing protein [Chitinivibrio alkaliphilus]|nr:HD domain-containing phosphohydrolase [Chitinivibrio alkaliphilus]